MGIYQVIEEAKWKLKSEVRIVREKSEVRMYGRRVRLGYG